MINIRLPNVVWKSVIIPNLDYPSQIYLSRVSKSFNNLIDGFFYEECKKRFDIQHLPLNKTWCRLYGEMTGLTLFWAGKFGKLGCAKTLDNESRTTKLSVMDDHLFSVASEDSFIDISFIKTFKKWNLNNWKFDYSPLQLIGPIDLQIMEQNVLSLMVTHVEIWDLKTGKKLGSVGEENNEHNACIQKRGNQFITGTIAGKIRLWELSGTCLWEEQAHSKGGVKWMSLYKNQLLTTNNHSFKIFDLDKKCTVKKFVCNHNVDCMQLMSDKIVFANANCEEIFVIQMKKKPVEIKLIGHIGGITCLQSHEYILLSGSFDRTIKIWNPENGECLSSLEGHSRTILSLAIWNDRIISGSIEGKIKIWKPHSKPSSKCEIF